MSHHPVLPIVAVLGQWRSGTSALAGTLHHLGFHLGTRLALLNAEHRHRRTFEAMDLMQIMWRSFNEPEMTPLRSLEETRLELARWITHHRQHAVTHQHPGLAMKHPSLSMAASVLGEIAPEIIMIRTDRTPEASWASMGRIGWDWPEREARLGLQRQYAAAAEHCGEDRTFAFPEFLRHPVQTVQRLVELTGITPTAEARQAAINSLQPRV